MRKRLIVAGVSTAALVLVLGLIWATALRGGSGNPPAASPAPGGSATPTVPAYTFAVLGNAPFGESQLPAFSERLEQINADERVELVAHIGDIKDDRTKCAVNYYEAVRRDFDKVVDPLLYTPGEFDWSTCHKPANGSYDPLDRLAALRETFFKAPERSLGQNRVDVASDAANGFPENRRYTVGDVAFGAVHLVGSDNGATPWAGRAEATNRQRDEITQRTESAVRLVRQTFAAVADRRGSIVVLLTQGDMFKSAAGDVKQSDSFGYGPVVREIAELSSQFAGEVYLINGDLQNFEVARPLANKSPWLKRYGIEEPLTNFTQISIGGASGATSYLRFSVDPTDRRYLVWEQVPFSN